MDFVLLLFVLRFRRMEKYRRVISLLKLLFQSRFYQKIKQEILNMTVVPQQKTKTKTKTEIMMPMYMVNMEVMRYSL
ncbi:hypothetical protein AC781_03845 [Akkermansia glycaniphila]|nr:hypothetical protein AC781_03845 [Akkermansia glycaniphila]